MLTAEQLEARQGGIGGSDLAAVLGLSPYKTPLDLYNEKLGLVELPDLSSNEAVHFGNVLEDVVADEFGRRTGLKPRRNNQHLVHKDHPFMLANIDRAIVGTPFGKKCGLECKTSDKWAAMNSDLWGPGAVFEYNSEGELVIAQYDDQVPDWYLMQCVHYMAVTDSDLWFLAVLIGGNDFRIYTIWRDTELEAMAIKRAAKFWNDHVLTQTPPAPSNVVDLETLYAKDNGQSVIATPEIINVWAEIKELQDQKKAIETRLDGQTLGKTKIGGLKNRLRMAIGPNSEILLDQENKPLATWKAPARGQTVFDMDAFKLAHPDLARKFTKKVPGSRRLLIK